MGARSEKLCLYTLLSFSRLRYFRKFGCVGFLPDARERRVA